MNKDTRTAWGQEFDAKREAWSSNNQLKAEIFKLREQLADANKKLATNKENDRVAEYHRAWEREEKLEGEG